MLNSVGESDEGEEAQQGKAEAKLGPTNNPRRSSCSEKPRHTYDR
jgi:hypothetical protein